MVIMHHILAACILPFIGDVIYEFWSTDVPYAKRKRKGKERISSYSGWLGDVYQKKVTKVLPTTLWIRTNRKRLTAITIDNLLLMWSDSLSANPVSKIDHISGPQKIFFINDWNNGQILGQGKLGLWGQCTETFSPLSTVFELSRRRSSEEIMLSIDLF